MCTINTTLKQLIGTPEGLTSNVEHDYNDIKGIKGSKPDSLFNSNTNSLTNFPQSTRARERAVDGFGAVIGGVLFDKLVIKKIEFTPRYLELKLHEILPIIVNKSQMDNVTSISPLNLNKLTPAKELTSNIGSILTEGYLILDGVDFSREKHVEIIIKVLDLQIEKSIELLKSWVDNSIDLSTDIPDHWEDFINKNFSVFSQKVREAKEIHEHRTMHSQYNSADDCVESFSFSIPPLWANSTENLQK